MVFYNEKEELYLERNGLGVDIRANHLQEEHHTWLPRNETQNKAVLQSIAFTDKSLISAEILYRT